MNVVDNRLKPKIEIMKVRDARPGTVLESAKAPGYFVMKLEGGMAVALAGPHESPHRAGNASEWYDDYMVVNAHLVIEP